MFNAVSNGVVDFVVGSAVDPYLIPSDAGAVDNTIYNYTAQSVIDDSQWESGQTVYAAGVVVRTLVIRNSAGTTAHIDFIDPPQVMLTDNIAATANNSTNLGGVAAVGYQTTAGLSANVATLTANNASHAYSLNQNQLNVNSAAQVVGKVTLDNAAVANSGLVPTNTIVIYDSLGQAYRIPCLI
jgi:hypothetical protein